MADKLLKVALVLSAVDKMSRTVGDAVSKSEQHIQKLKKSANAAFGTGASRLGAGAAMAASLLPVVDAYKDLEDSSIKLKSVMLRDGNKIDETLFGKVNNEAIRLGNLLPGTTADFQNLFATMIETGVQAESILNGSGQAAAYLAVQLGLDTVEAGKLAGKLQNAMGIPDRDMMKMMDFMARMKNVNVEATEMQYAFAKSSMAMKSLGVQGLDSAKVIGNLFAQMISTGQTGETVGTNFARILQEITNPTKLAKFQEAAKAYGITIDLFDKAGNFKGMSNFVGEFGKFNGMDIQNITKIIEPLVGESGVDMGFLQALGMSGVESFNKMNKRLFEQAQLTDKVNLRLTTFKNMWEATTGTFTNFLAAIGESFAPEMKKVVDLLGKASAKMQGFASSHKGIFRIIVGVIVLSALLLSLLGTIALVRGAFLLMTAQVAGAIGALNYALFATRFYLMTSIIPAIWAAVTASWAWTAAMLANPITWIVLAVVAALALLGYVFYKYWDTIKPYLLRLWAFIKAIGMVLLLPLIWPVLLVIKHWDKLKAFFFKVIEFLKPFASKLWGMMKTVAKFLLMPFIKLGSVFLNVGKTIIKMLWQGIKNSVHFVFDLMDATTKKIREFLPFSPAKRGAFRDLHKVKIMETIAMSMKPAPLMNAMSNATSAAVGFARPQYAGASTGGSGGTTTITFAPVVHLNGSANGSDAKLLTGAMKVEFEKLMKNFLAQQKRTAY